MIPPKWAGYQAWLLPIRLVLAIALWLIGWKTNKLLRASATSEESETHGPLGLRDWLGEPICNPLSEAVKRGLLESRAQRSSSTSHRTLMARKRRNPNFKAVRINNAAAAGTLGSLDVVSDTTVAAADAAYYAISIECTYNSRDFTANQGPLLFGYAHSDYADAEIEEWIETISSINRGSLVEAEIAQRKCRLVGSFPTATASESFNDGKPVRTKLGWHVPIGDGLKFWIYNGGEASLTTGGTIRNDGTMFIRYT